MNPTVEVAMSAKWLLRRRPSAPLVLSLVALFVALGGASYAATQVPFDSVGSAQLQNGAVTNWKLGNGSVGNWKLAFGSVGARKIINGSVGKSQINTSQVQARVTGTCATGAVSAIDSGGKVTCATAPPNEFGTSSQSVTVGTSQTPVAGMSLPGGSAYLVSALPQVTITTTSGTPQQVEVDCTLTGTGANLTRSLQVQASNAGPVTETIPLTTPVSSSTTSSPTAVGCIEKSSTPSTPAPTVAVISTLNAIQTATNNSVTNSG
jgi:hypothetical protein